MNLTLLALLSLPAILIGLFFFGLLNSLSKGKYLLKLFGVILLTLVFMLLFGPLVAYSPVKFGFQLSLIEKIPIYHNEYFSSEDLRKIAKTIETAQTEVGRFFANSIPVEFYLVDKNLDEIRLGGSLFTREINLGPAKVIIKKDRLNYQDLVKELSYRYLPKLSRRSRYYFPRWFDEGLALFLALPPDSLKAEERRQQLETLKNSLNLDRYQKDLDYWNGFTGALRWQTESSFKLKNMQVQSYFLVNYLTSLYGEEGLRNLIESTKEKPNFAEAFQETFDKTVSSFHQEFLKSISGTL